MAKKRRRKRRKASSAHTVAALKARVRKALR